MKLEEKQWDAYLPIVKYGSKTIQSYVANEKMFGSTLTCNNYEHVALVGCLWSFMGVISDLLSCIMIIWQSFHIGFCVHFEDSCNRFGQCRCPFSSNILFQCWKFDPFLVSVLIICFYVLTQNSTDIWQHSLNGQV